MTKTEIALVLSHRKCWDLFEQSGDEACVILEDDVHFGAGFAAFMTGYPPFPADFDLIKIETTPFKVWLDKHNPRRVMGDRKLMRLASPHMGAAGYVLSRAGLPKVRALAAAMKYPADVVLFGEPAKELIIYQLTPSLVIQDNALKKKPDYAALAGTVDRGRKPQVRGLRKVMRELGRPFRGIWPPGPITKKWRLTYGRVKFE
jgi:glycosyl transferase family 25